jgi:RHS repeat-associated protein
VWRWDQQEPFGNNPASEDPDANTVAFDLPLRLPGQRYDAETGLHQNFFRDYDPSIGRYGESDPIGLYGGINTYAYASVDPVKSGDVFGLVPDGCGTVRDISRFLPNLFYRDCCNQHDDCYDDCANRPGKDGCDREFSNCTFRTCSKRWVALRFVCEIGAFAYGRGPRGDEGQGAFNDARQKCGKSCKP